eukprot:15120451-Ditylum_brightwellii.AAC.1
MFLLGHVLRSVFKGESKFPATADGRCINTCICCLFAWECLHICYKDDAFLGFDVNVKLNLLIALDNSNGIVVAMQCPTVLHMLGEAEQVCNHDCHLDATIGQGHSIIQWGNALVYEIY